MKPPWAIVFVVAASLHGGVAFAQPAIVLDPDPKNGTRSGWFAPAAPSAEVLVRTHPSNAQLELLYVRAEQTRLRRYVPAPVRLSLPARAPGDVLLLRAVSEGYRTVERALHVARLPETVELVLEPLPNALVAATHLQLVGRRLLMLWTTEPADLRIQESGEAVHVVLAETRSQLPARHDFAPEFRVDPVGEDLFLAVALEAGWHADQELRAHQARDPARGLERTVVEWVPRDGGVAATQRARAALAAVEPTAVDGCGLAFERRLRERTPPGILARALAPTGRFIDAVKRSALQRLAEFSREGRVELTDGTQFDPARPIEADFVMGRAAEARGYLAVLAAFVREAVRDEESDQVLATLIAPELPRSDVAALIADARAVELRCRTGN